MPASKAFINTSFKRKAYASKLYRAGKNKFKIKKKQIDKVIESYQTRASAL